MARAITFEIVFAYLRCMDSKVTIVDRISSLSSDADFAALAGEIFDYQRKHNALYGRFVQGVFGNSSFNLDQPALLPIQLFKFARVSCHDTEETIFLSSGTTLSTRSQHPVYDLSLYERLSIQHFESIYGSLKDLVILALLPSYEEQGSSSLVFMVDRFILRADPRSKFLLHEPHLLKQTLSQLAEEKQPAVLFGVSYALLDFVELHKVEYPELILMETGGMKGRRKEMTRDELHAALKLGFPASRIHSEYGMTELLSQGYLNDQGRFIPPRWMKAFTSEISDPLRILGPGERGLLAFIDLANVHSCSFIQTQDIGIVQSDGTFSVEGRLDTSDLRGCNLLYT